MSKKIQLLKSEIENQRNILTKIVSSNNHNIQTKEVLRQSTCLDNLIVEYQKFLRESNQNKMQSHKI